MEYDEEKGAMFCHTCGKYYLKRTNPALCYIKLSRLPIEESSAFVGARRMWSANTTQIERKSNN